MSVATPNIWYVAHYAGGPGVGRHSRGWYLSRTWQQAGARATVIAANRHHMLDTEQPAGARNVEGVDYHFLPTSAYSNNGIIRIINMFAFVAAFWSARDELVHKYGRPDVIISSSPHPFVFPITHRLARSLGARSVFEVRDLWPASMIDIMNLSSWHPMVMLTGSIERYAYKNADAVVSLLPQTEEYMRARGLSGDRWYYVPNGIVQDEVSVRPDQSPIFDQIDAWHAEGFRVICYTGALGVPNNLDRLLDAMAVLKGREIPVRALIVGRGDAERDLRTQCTALGLDERVRFFGQVPKAVARAIQESVDIGFIALKPSPVFRFGISPNKIFDYMTSSLPVISAIDAGNDIVSEAGCGISIPSGCVENVAEAIASLAEMDASHRQKLGARGREFVSIEHNYELLAKRYLESVLPLQYDFAK